jgi:hypothetical protein
MQQHLDPIFSQTLQQVIEYFYYNVSFGKRVMDKTD